MANTFLNKDGLSHLVSKLKTYIASQISAHTSNKSNPHGVTKSQVGLGSVANIDQSKAIKSISRSGTTFTATALDGTKTTFDQQDSNTTYGVATSSTNGLMSSGDKSKLDNLQVGGRNLYYLKDFSLLDKINISSFSVESGEITVTASDSDMFFGSVSLSSGETYSEKFGSLMYVEGASFVTALISNHEFNKNYFTFFDKDKKSISYIRFTSNSAKGIVVPSGATYCTLRVGKGDAVPGTAYKTRVKVERGTVATDWTPAPEDFQSVTKSFTLSASSWSSGAYTISDSLITASSNQEILPATTITAAQYNALSTAQIIDGGQSAGKLTLKALGTVPTIDIPIRIIFRGTI